MQEQEHLKSKQEGAKKASERSHQNLADKLKSSGLKLPLYPTPQIIERARTIMGSIDFDPTADPVQQVLVDATSIPSVEVNPLQEHWHGNVWVAPKGAVRNSRIWLNKTISEYRNGHIKSFVFFSSASELLRASPVIWDYPVCIPFKRVKFIYNFTKDNFSIAFFRSKNNYDCSRFNQIFFLFNWKQLGKSICSISY